MFWRKKALMRKYFMYKFSEICILLVHLVGDVG